MAHIDGRIARVARGWVRRRTAGLGLEVNFSTVFSVRLLVGAGVIAMIMTGMIVTCVISVLGMIAVIVMITFVRQSGRECIGRDDQSCGKSSEAKF